MAFPYMIGPGGQPFMIQQIQQIPIMPQVIQAQQPQPPQPPPVQPPPKVPDYMSEDRLQEKGESKLYYFA